MRRIKNYKEEQNGNFIVYFECEENPLFCNSKEFAVLQCEDMLTRQIVSRDIFRTLTKYKEAIADEAYDRGYEAGIDYGSTP